MPTWGEILVEIRERASQGDKAPFDYVRRKYLAELHKYTSRNTILYATNWTDPRGFPPAFVSIGEDDVQALMGVFKDLPSGGLDLILHSPGGSAETTEAVVSYVRSKFSDLRVIIPYAAMSAATMLACSAQKIVMGKHSFLGPIDPQMLIADQYGNTKAVPAQAILDQFEKAKQECLDPRVLGVWAPILPQYGPALLIESSEALGLSKELVAKWLEKYMFAGQGDAKQKADAAAASLADHTTFKTHGRHIDRSQARGFGLIIEDLETDQKFQDLVLSVFHSMTHTFTSTTAVKIVENHLGRAFLVQAGLFVQQPPTPSPAPPEQAKPTPSATPQAKGE